MRGPELPQIISSFVRKHVTNLNPHQVAKGTTSYIRKPSSHTYVAIL